MTLAPPKIGLWVEHALCPGYPAEWFNASAGHHLGRQVCAGCPVRQECEDWGVEHELEHNLLWGGLDLQQRMRRRR